MTPKLKSLAPDLSPEETLYFLLTSMFLSQSCPSHIMVPLLTLFPKHKKLSFFFILSFNSLIQPLGLHLSMQITANQSFLSTSITPSSPSSQHLSSRSHLPVLQSILQQQPGCSFQNTNQMIPLLKTSLLPIPLRIKLKLLSWPTGLALGYSGKCYPSRFTNKGQCEWLDNWRGLTSSSGGGGAQSGISSAIQQTIIGQVRRTILLLWILQGTRHGGCHSYGGYILVGGRQ